MNDAEYLFRQTSAERKRIGRGDFNKKRQGGKQVRLPSDNLSRKEWEKMNGECKTYDMAKPVAWEYFKLWPADLQRSYLLGLGEKFGIGVAHLADMFHISRCSIYNLMNKLNVHLDGRHPGRDLKPWFAFVNGEALEAPVKAELPPEVLVPSGEETSAIKIEEPAKIDMSNLSDAAIDRLCDLIKALKGTGSIIDLKIVT